MQLTWRASEPASAMYAAVCLAGGYAPVDQRLSDVLGPPALGLVDELMAAGLPHERAMAMLHTLAASGVDDNRQLAQQALVRLLGAAKVSETTVGRLAGQLSALEAAMQRFHQVAADDRSRPLVDELLLRGRPLAGQWDARGQGMMNVVARMTEADLVAERADVVLVYPVLGGYGAAHLPVNTVSIEAMLVNPHEDLPEVVRLGWLLAQLNLDLPKFAEHVSAGRLGAVAARAMIPPVLAAADYVELAHLDAPTIGRALAEWRVAAADDAADQAETLLAWWTTYDQGHPPWPVALAALEEMLDG